MRKIIAWLMTTKLYRYVLKEVIPYIRFSAYYPSIRGSVYQEGYLNLEPGDIILTVDYKKLTTLLIPGTFAHAALSAGRTTSTWTPEVYEMTHTDFTLSKFFDVCKEADRVAIVRCLDWDQSYIKDMLAYAYRLRFAKYDATFSLGVEALYCSELIYQADWERRLKCDLSDLAGLGREYISPDGLLFSENVKVIWDSSGQLNGKSGLDCIQLLSKSK